MIGSFRSQRRKIWLNNEVTTYFGLTEDVLGAVCIETELLDASIFNLEQ